MRCPWKRSGYVCFGRFRSRAWPPPKLCIPRLASHGAAPATIHGNAPSARETLDGPSRNTLLQQDRPSFEHVSCGLHVPGGESEVISARVRLLAIAETAPFGEAPPCFDSLSQSSALCHGPEDLPSTMTRLLRSLAKLATARSRVFMALSDRGQHMPEVSMRRLLHEAKGGHQHPMCDQVDQVKLARPRYGQVAHDDDAVLAMKNSGQYEVVRDTSTRAKQPLGRRVAHDK